MRHSKTLRAINQITFKNIFRPYLKITSFSSIVGEDFGLTSYIDGVYEVQTIEQGEDWSAPITAWMNDVSFEKSQNICL